MLNPILLNDSAELNGVAPPLIIFATSGVLISFPICFISSIDLGASTKTASALVFLFYFPRSFASSNPSVALASVLATIMKSLFSLASIDADNFSVYSS